MKGERNKKFRLIPSLYHVVLLKIQFRIFIPITLILSITMIKNKNNSLLIEVIHYVIRKNDRNTLFLVTLTNSI